MVDDKDDWAKIDDSTWETKTSKKNKKAAKAKEAEDNKEDSSPKSDKSGSPKMKAEEVASLEKVLERELSGGSSNNNVDEKNVITVTIDEGQPPKKKELEEKTPKSGNLKKASPAPRKDSKSTDDADDE